MTTVAVSEVESPPTQRAEAGDHRSRTPPPVDGPGPGPAARGPEGLLRGGLVAGAVLAAGAHGAMAWERADHFIGPAVYLAVAAALCLVWAAALIRFPSRRTVAVGLVDCLAAIAVWAITGPLRLPLGGGDPSLGAGALGSPLLAALDGAMGGVALALLVVERRGRRPAREAPGRVGPRGVVEITCDGMTLPQWLSVKEAAFLSGIDPPTLATRAQTAGVKLVAVRGRTRSFPFARTEDLVAVGLLEATVRSIDDPAPLESAPPSPPRRIDDAPPAAWREADTWVALPARRRSRR